MNINYKLEDKPPLPQSIVLAVQHILAAFNGIIAVPLVVGGAVMMGKLEMSAYISAAIFCAGLVTLMQILAPLGIGSRLPCIMGTSFTFVGPAISVAKQFGMGAMFTATVLASLVETTASFFIPLVRKLFPRVVTSAVVTLIGLSLIPVAADWTAGGFGTADYGSVANLGIAVFVIAIIMILISLKNKFINTSAVFLGMLAGYILCIPLGKVDFTPIMDARWFSLPTPFRYGFSFHWAAILPFVVAYMVTTIETIGDLTATAEVSGKKITEEELRGGILCDGVGSAIGGIFSAGANTTFSQNIGIIGITGVASRYVVTISGIILMILGICPKLGAIIATMPVPVLGGAGLIMFGMVASAGMSGMRDVEPTSRNTLIYTIAIVCGLTVVFRPTILEKLPEVVRMMLSSGITTGTLVAVVLNTLLPERE